MQFIDLQAQRERIKDKIDARIRSVLDHGKYIMGPEVNELEAKLAVFSGAKFCSAVANGTDALQIALMALEIGPGDEVITTPFSFFATVETICILGAIPIFVDIDPETYNLDPSKLEAAITSKTKAIIPVSLYGQCADFDEINQIANKHNLPVIEDAAQSFGATYKQKRSCNLSTIATTSFFPSKPLGCYGDGGALFTSDSDLAARISQIRLHGQDKRYSHAVIGMNSRMDTLQAAILLEKLEIFEDELHKRDEVASRYIKQIGNGIRTPKIRDYNTSAWAQFTIEVDARENFCNALKERGIPTAIHYPRGLHQQSAITKLGLKTQPMPVTEKVANRVVSLPMHPYLEASEQDAIVSSLVESLEKAA